MNECYGYKVDKKYTLNCEIIIGMKSDKECSWDSVLKTCYFFQKQDH